jgi:hypothetical protein
VLVLPERVLGVAELPWVGLPGEVVVGAAEERPDRGAALAAELGPVQGLESGGLVGRHRSFIQHHFGSRDALLAAALERLVDV